MAAFTRLEPAQASPDRARSPLPAAFHGDVEQLVAPSPSAATLPSPSAGRGRPGPPKTRRRRTGVADGRIAGGAVREREHAVVGGHVPVHGQRVEAAPHRLLPGQRRGCSASRRSRSPPRVIVASDGAIIPEPLQMQVRVTSLPPMRTVRAASFMRVSVVMIACGGGRGSAFSERSAPASAATILCAGSLTPDHTGPRRSATAPAGDAQLLRHRLAHGLPRPPGPLGPVSALALPRYDHRPDSFRGSRSRRRGRRGLFARFA